MENEEFNYENVEIFLNELMEYADEYDDYLSESLSPGTVSKHMQIIKSWCEFICVGHGVTGFDKITVSLARSKFYYWFMYHEDRITASFTYNAIKKFLLFIYEDYGVGNVALMNKLKKK
jgi:hypothetical protein